jgi:hypothetical protein
MKGGFMKVILFWIKADYFADCIIRVRGYRDVKNILCANRKPRKMRTVEWECSVVWVHALCTLVCFLFSDIS